jgi:hypothetical protein
MTAVTTFALESQDCRAVQGAAAPLVRKCGTCALFSWSTGPTGRRRPSEKGYCGWRFPWPEKWPPCFRDACNGAPRRPQPSRVWAEYDGKSCELWRSTKA